MFWALFGLLYCRDVLILDILLMKTEGSCFAVTREDWDRLQSDVLEILRLLEDRTEEDFRERWVESCDVRRLLGISQRTWQMYRDNRVIPFCQIGRKIYVRMRDIEDFLERHRVPADGAV